MAGYTRAAIYDYVARYVNSINGYVKCYSVPERVLPVLPALVIEQTGLTDTDGTIDGSYGAYRCTCQATVYSDRLNGGLEEVGEIMSVVLEAFHSLGFRQTLSRAIENVDVNVLRHIATFVRTCGEGETIPELPGNDEQLD